MASSNPVKAHFASAGCSSYKADIDHSKSPLPCSASAQNPVDLLHLSKQSLGDKSLETEILHLFKSQSSLYLERLKNAKTAEERRFASHTLVGSARGLGAWKVAEEAQKIELHCSKSRDIKALQTAVNEANRYIEDLLGE